ncbi:peptidase E [Bacillus spongiae]|uniref:Peptidase E n=1 Tax=Bacillus spongiae TaxID=2683610 RepID=A0ABU8HEH1_9BACI
MQQIIALGGGGFSMEPNNPLLDTYILQQVKDKEPKICFIPTASGDAENYIARFYKFFEKQACLPTHFSLFKPPTTDLEGFLLEQDILYVGGGNTINLLALWREWGVDKIIQTAYNKGIVLTGLSAGSLCWFEEGVTDSFGDELRPIKGLGLLKGSHCPHYDGEDNRRPSYHETISAKNIKSGVAADDGVALHYINGKLIRVVSSRPQAHAYHVSLKDENIIEKRMSAMYLGD